MQEGNRILCPGGTLRVAVPADQWLWSYLDVDAGHLRRYSKRSIFGLVQEAGLVVEHVRLYQCLLLPLMVVRRLLGRRGPQMRNLEDNPPGLINRLLRGINLSEINLGGMGVTMPFGSSVLVVARKPGGPAHA